MSSGTGVGSLEQMEESSLAQPADARIPQTPAIIHIFVFFPGQIPQTRAIIIQ